VFKRVSRNHGRAYYFLKLETSGRFGVPLNQESRPELRIMLTSTQEPKLRNQKGHKKKRHKFRYHKGVINEPNGIGRGNLSGT
jgi:hypothetical protein